MLIFLFFFLMIRRPPRSTLFPYTRSSDLSSSSATRSTSTSSSTACSTKAWPVIPSLPSEASSRSEEHTSELQSLRHLVCRLLLEKKKTALSEHVIADRMKIGRTSTQSLDI